VMGNAPTLVRAASWGRWGGAGADTMVGEDRIDSIFDGTCDEEHGHRPDHPQFKLYHYHGVDWRDLRWGVRSGLWLPRAGGQLRVPEPSVRSGA
jgi:hypothetical protein